MISRKMAVGLVGAAMVAAMAGMAWQPPADASKPAAQPSAEEQAWADAAKLGPNHDLIAKFAGTWRAEVSMWMAPGAPPEKSEGSMVSTMTLGGRYLRQEFTGEMMGGPFEGIGYWGYDNVKKEFISTWMDSMSTGVMIGKGQYDAGKKTFTLWADMPDPATGKDSKIREVTIIVSDDEHKFEMHGTGPDGKEAKIMEIVYTRAGPPAKAGQ